MQDSSHLPVLTWSAALSEVDQETIIQMRPLAITWPEDIGEEVTDNRDLVEIMDDLEAKNDDHADVVVEFERDITADQSWTVTFGDTTSRPCSELHRSFFRENKI